MESKEVLYAYVVTKCMTPITMHLLFPDGEYYDDKYDGVLLSKLADTYECVTAGYWPNVVQLHEKVFNIFNKVTFKSLGVDVPDEHVRLNYIKEVYLKKYGSDRQDNLPTGNS